jgi:hypothetical protein
LQALPLACIFEQSGLLQTQAVDGFLKILILAADIVQVKIVLPQIIHAQLGGMDEPLGRRNQRIGPKTEEADAGAVAWVESAVAIPGAAHLRGQTDDLRQQNYQQHGKISIAGEKRFQGSRGVRDQGSGCCEVKVSVPALKRFQSGCDESIPARELIPDP